MIYLNVRLMSKSDIGAETLSIPRVNDDIITVHFRFPQPKQKETSEDCQPSISRLCPCFYFFIFILSVLSVVRIGPLFLFPH